MRTPSAKSEICYNGQACPTGTVPPHVPVRDDLEPDRRRDYRVLGHKLVDVLKSGQQFAMYMMWYGLGRTWIESIRINYSTIILGLRVNV